MDCWPIVHKINAVVQSAVRHGASRHITYPIRHFNRIVAKPVEHACKQTLLLAKPAALAVTAGVLVGPTMHGPIPPEFIVPSIAASPTGNYTPLSGFGFGLTGLFAPDIPVANPVSRSDQAIFEGLLPLPWAMIDDPHLPPVPDLPPAVDGGFPPEHIPEPRTLGLIAAGLAGLLWIRRYPPGIVARAMARKSSATRLAPPTSAPPTSGTAINAIALAGLTDPP